ncbi:BON domain-containing protein [Caldimonas tepidiphila]|uniref:BON domain-containing protein n=1 Tax=Caldimonas tepidiphila TaxID=2315841 RepID=UPI0013006685|nr:BON domain-containing protein [Caldimonas tepidiphila]
MRRMINPLAAAALGAVAMYYLDPDRGYRRRVRMLDGIDRISHEVGNFMHEQSLRAADQARGLASSASRPFVAAAGALGSMRERVDEVSYDAGDYAQDRGHRFADRARELAASARRPFSRASEAVDDYLFRQRVRNEVDRVMEDRSDLMDRAEAEMAEMPRSGSLLGGLMKVMALCAASAAAMYYLDPQHGRQRRTMVRDRFDTMTHDAGDYARAKGRMAADRIKGVASSASAPFAGMRQSRNDRKLQKQLSSQLGRWVNQPQAIEVEVSQGDVCLRGHVLAAELDTLLSAVRAMPGVQHVDNQLEVHQDAGAMPALHHGANLALADRSGTGRTGDSGVVH